MENFINATVLGFGFTFGVILSLFFMCFVGAIINLLFIEIQARLLVREVEKEIKRKEKENDRA